MNNYEKFYSLMDMEIPSFPPGLVWMVGAGPGDPGLISFHGVYALSKADIVVYDALVNTKLLAICLPNVEKIYAGKRGGKPSATQKGISLKLIEFAKKGCRVVRLKGGDPFIFGRGGDEALALAKEAIPVRVTPGISAGVGALACTGIPLTYRETNQSITFITGHDQNGGTPQALDWEFLAKGAQVLVIYMGIKNLDLIVEKLLAFRRDPKEPVAVVSNATCNDQKFIESTLGQVTKDVVEKEMKAPAIICVGWNVALHRVISPALDSLLNCSLGEC